MTTVDGKNLCVTKKSFINTGKSLSLYLNNQLMPPLPHEIIINILKMSLKPLSPSSNTPMPSLPPEMIINILKRLPIKSLLRLQSVCKDWGNLFKSSFFIQEHSTHNNPIQICYTCTFYDNRSRLALVRYDNKMEAMKVERIPPILEPKKIFLYNQIIKTVKDERLPTIIDPLTRISALIGSCNGLLCMISNEASSLFLLNPVTKELRQISISANYNLNNEACFWGFGHSSIGLDYKIVSICPNYDGAVLKKGFYFVKLVKVFPLRKWSWRNVELGVLKSIAINHRYVTIDGTMFWLGLSNEFGDGIVVSFDLAVEVFTLIPMPSSNINVGWSMLDVYKNKVTMHQGYYGSAFWDLWVLEDGSGAYGKMYWSKKYSIRTLCGSYFPKCLCRDEMMGFSKIDGGPNSFFILTSRNEWKKIHSSLYAFEISTSFSYVQSIASICPTPMLNKIKLPRCNSRE